jgi:DNA polymerase III subunit gamma/tau
MEEHVVLYRQFRPLTFDDVIGQKASVGALRQAVISGRLAHAYLFCGQHGTGKTTIAKIFSRAVNCEHPVNGNPCNECPTCKGILDGSILDVVEMDAASNNGVDDIRPILREVNFTPTRTKFKVYIIDEVHMLSKGAFNALLKTIEEPPAHVLFLFATTEVEKIPATIISRCQRYEFRRIPIDDIVKRMRDVSDKVGIKIEDDALKLIASRSDGALRDALSLLDQISYVSPDKDKVITTAQVEQMTGTVDSTFLFKRILHLLLRDLICFALTGRGRELCRISPFRVRRQDIIGIEPCLVHFLELKSTVLRTGRPVHKLIWLIGTLIEIINAQHLSDIPGDRHELLRCHIPCHRNKNTRSGVLRSTGMRSIQAGGIRHRCLKGVHVFTGKAVTIKGKDRPLFDRIYLAPAALQHTADKAAVVFCRITL